MDLRGAGNEVRGGPTRQDERGATVAHLVGRHVGFDLVENASATALLGEGGKVVVCVLASVRIDGRDFFDRPT